MIKKRKTPRFKLVLNQNNKSKRNETAAKIIIKKKNICICRYEKKGIGGKYRVRNWSKESKKLQIYGAFIVIDRRLFSWHLSSLSFSLSITLFLSVWVIFSLGNIRMTHNTTIATTITTYNCLQRRRVALLIFQLFFWFFLFVLVTLAKQVIITS